MGPLEGIKIIELAAIGPVPLCAMLLADLGADVVRVDRIEPSGLGIPLDQRFEVNNRSRRSIAVDLKRAEGLDAMLRLADKADVLMEGFRPGVAERLGLGPDVCLSRNGRLVYGRMTGFGQDGVLANAAGHDLNYIALTGAYKPAVQVNANVAPLSIQFTSSSTATMTLPNGRSTQLVRYRF